MNIKLTFGSNKDYLRLNFLVFGYYQMVKLEPKSFLSLISLDARGDTCFSYDQPYKRYSQVSSEKKYLFVKEQKYCEKNGLSGTKHTFCVTFMFLCP